MYYSCLWNSAGAVLPALCIHRTFRDQEFCNVDRRRNHDHRPRFGAA